MKEKEVTVINKILYYAVAPCLLLYFLLIDMSIIKCKISVLVVFFLAIIIGVSINIIYKKKKSDYKFDINEKYAKAMMILVFLELAFNFTKI